MQREQTDGGKVQTKGADWPGEGSYKGSRLMEGRFRQRKQTGREEVQTKGAE